MRSGAILDQFPSGRCEMKLSYLKFVVKHLIELAVNYEPDVELQLTIGLPLITRHYTIFASGNFYPIHADDL